MIDKIISTIWPDTSPTFSYLISSIQKLDYILPPPPFLGGGGGMLCNQKSLINVSKHRALTFVPNNVLRNLKNTTLTKKTCKPQTSTLTYSHIILNRSITSTWHFTNSQFSAKQINFILPRNEHYIHTASRLHFTQCVLSRRVMCGYKERPNCYSGVWMEFFLVVVSFWAFNPLNAELNPICHLLALLVAHHILHISRIRVK